MNLRSRPLVLALLLPLSWGEAWAGDCRENRRLTTIEEHRFTGPLPMTGYPSLETLIANWTSPSNWTSPIDKGEYETTSEFEKRQTEFSRRNEETPIAYVPLGFSYDADLEHYVVDTCVYKEIPQDDLAGQTVGLSAENAKRRVYVRTTRRCEEKEEKIIPMNLKKAREISDVVQILGLLSFPHDHTSIYPEEDTFWSENPENTRPEFFLLNADLRFIILGRTDTREILAYHKMPREGLGDSASPVRPCLETITERSVRKVAPIYPRRAVTRGITGYCIVEYTVTAMGKIKDPFPADCWPKNTFEEASVKAASQFIYEPKWVDGVPVEVTGVQHKFTYELEQ